MKEDESFGRILYCNNAHAIIIHGNQIYRNCAMPPETQTKTSPRLIQTKAYIKS
jgi:hypothetical protein